MPYHPETRENEEFVGNIPVHKVQEKLAPFSTARVGNQAYDIHGKPLPKTYMLPFFIGRVELEKYDQMMTAASRAARSGNGRRESQC